MQPGAVALARPSGAQPAPLALPDLPRPRLNRRCAVCSVSPCRSNSIVVVVPRSPAQPMIFGWAVAAEGREIPLALRCLCAAGTGLDALVQELHENDPDSLRLSIEAFSPIALAHALAACDLVLLPGASRAHPSSLLAALRAGRFAISHPDPGYEDLAEFAWTGNDLGEGIRWALTHPHDVLERLHRAKYHVERLHAPVAVARHWVTIFQDNVV